MSAVSTVKTVSSVYSAVLPASLMVFLRTKSYISAIMRVKARLMRNTQIDHGQDLNLGMLGFNKEI